MSGAEHPLDGRGSNADPPERPDSAGRPASDVSPAWRIIAIAAFALLLGGLWVEYRNSPFAQPLGGHIVSAFFCLALLLAPLWFFGFGAANALRSILHKRWQSVAMASLGCLPNLVFSIPRHEFQWVLALAMAGFPVLLAAVLAYPEAGPRFSWRDAVVLLALATVLELGLLTPAWPFAGLGSLPKLYLADVALYLYLVVRPIDGMGYSLIPTGKGLLIAMREWLFFAPLGIGLGLALKFIAFHPRLPSPSHAITAIVVTFLLTAMPEELFFRGILQNLLEGRLGRTGSLILASALFGLSHFHKGAAFNWRYVLLATIAGVFYGRAWRAERRVMTSALTHTAVDVVWGLWFR